MNKRGFSLVETFLTACLISLVLIVVTGIIIDGYRYYGAISSHNSLMDSGSLIVQTINSEVRLTSTLPGTYTNNNTLYTQNASTLILEMPSIDINNLPIGSSYDHVIFQKQGSNLSWIIVPAAGSKRPNQNKIMNSTISSLIFTITNQTGRNLIDTNLTLSTLVDNQTKSFNIQSSAITLNQ